MTKMVGKGIPVPHLGQRVSVIDVDVHETLPSVRDLTPYLDEPWRSRVEIPDGFAGIDRFPYSYSQVAGLTMSEAVIEHGAPAGSSYQLMRDQLLDP
jgi:uncharacterized protein